MELKDLKVPFAVFSFLIVQLCGAIWWSAQIDARVEKLESEVEELWYAEQTVCKVDHNQRIRDEIELLWIKKLKECNEHTKLATQQSEAKERARNREGQVASQETGTAGTES